MVSPGIIDVFFRRSGSELPENWEQAQPSSTCSQEAFFSLGEK